MSQCALRWICSVTLIAVGSLAGIQQASATHIRAGEITVRRNGCGTEFIITITVYTNTGSVIRFSNDGSGILDFGDGTQPHNPPQIENSPVPGFGPEYGYVSYSKTHNYSAGTYIISYFEHNRNADIHNMSNSVETPFYIQTMIKIDPFLGCDNSPLLLVPPIDKACSGAAWYHNPGAYDPDGDSLSFEMTVPLQDKGRPVGAYSDPNSKPFYDMAGIDYATANENQDSTPSFSIDSRTGTVLWDAPGAVGLYNIAFKIIEWRKLDGTWIMLGYVTRDMQIEVDDCQNHRPELIVPPDLCVLAGDTVNAKIYGVDPDYDSVKIEAYSQVFTLNPMPATYTPFPARFQQTFPDSAFINFQWITNCADIKEQPYQVVFKITDNPPPGRGARLVQFKTWNIKVVAPPPIWKSAIVAPGRRANLKWKGYSCTKDANIMQIWRRVDSYPFTPPNCVTGMPPGLGYTKIAEVPILDTTYVDNNGGRGLSPAAQYCYRLVAVFPLPEGGESYVSQEICVYILADAPVVTNVSITKTDLNNGEIMVKWRPPFEADTLVNPKPFQYQVFRAEGFAGTVGLVPAMPGKQKDTVFVDAGLNSTNLVYNYRILAFDSNKVLIDTSATASTVRLELTPHLKEIDLNWFADVPWSNQLLNYPMHLIYRGPANSTESDMVLIDSVNSGEGFHYADSGQYQNTPLKETQTYCYRVLTRGGYGNPKIREPLENFSEIICGQPNDSIPPCSPKLKVTGTDCSENSIPSTCGLNSFSNLLTWRKPDDADCAADTKSYNVYVASQKGNEFSLYASNVRDTFFIDANLASFARCYKVSAVDRSGNESDLSEEFCFDNCPYYELPNVFTPNDDHCNDLFSAYSDRYPLDENGNDACGKVDVSDRKKRCARFVDHVNFTVYNRWGKEVYSYQSGTEQSIYIDWNGKDDGGKDLAPGVYYYIAQVTFVVVDPAQQVRNIRGWVQLVR